MTDCLQFATLARRRACLEQLISQDVACTRLIAAAMMWRRPLAKPRLGNIALHAQEASRRGCLKVIDQDRCYSEVSCELRG